MLIQHFTSINGSHETESGLRRGSLGFRGRFECVKRTKSAFNGFRVEELEENSLFYDSRFLHKPDRQAGREHTGKSILISAHNAEIAFDVKERVPSKEERRREPSLGPGGAFAYVFLFRRTKKKLGVFMQNSGSQRQRRAGGMTAE
jgi:hypothetical protein